MKKLTLALSLLLTGILALAITPRAQETTVTTGGTVVLGTFDSRGVALAFYRSAAFMDTMMGLQEELAEAKADGNAEKVSDLEQRGPALQEEAHRRTFGSASVRELLDPHKEEVARIAESMGVDVVVSHWDQAYRGPKAQSIDLTLELVHLFDPGEKTLQVLDELLETEPVAASDLKHDH